MLPKELSLVLPLLLGLLLAQAAGAQGYSLLTGSGIVSPRAPDVERALPWGDARRPLFDAHAASPGAEAAGTVVGPRAPTSFGAVRQPLVQARAEIPDTAAAEAARGRAQSLFIGRASQGFFGSVSPRVKDVRRGGTAPGRYYAPNLDDDPQAAMLRHLIAEAEAGRDGYDAVQHGARHKPARPPTQMTLAEIFAWIEATPGQPHAIGRYQFIPSTLARLVTILDAGPDEVFSPQLQDRLADILLQDAGFDAFRAGEIERTTFMNNLAKIWAGLPNSSGRSHYHGHAGNIATVSWVSFDSEMARIFPG